MNILQIIPNLSGGGAERFTVDLSNELSKKNNVMLLTLYDPGKDDLFRNQLLPAVKTQSLGKQLGFDWKVILELHKAIKRIKPDVIHNHLRSFNYLMPLIPFLGDIPIIHTVHSDAFKECSNEKIRRMRTLFFKRKNTVPVTISNESNASFRAAYADTDSHLIYNGRQYPEESTSFDKVCEEINHYKENADTKVFIHVGRLHPLKNQLMIVDAFKKLINEEKANAILIMVGGVRNDEESHCIEKYLKKAEKEYANIHILGQCSNATDYLHAADYFCMASQWEGMPMSLIEALATGTIPVCTSVGGMTEMVEPLNHSLLSESVSMDDYYEVLKRVYELPLDKQKDLKREAKALFKRKYSIARCSNDYLNLYR